MTYPNGSAYRRSAPASPSRGSQGGAGYPRGGRVARPTPMAPHPMSAPAVPGRSGVPRIPGIPASAARAFGRLPIGMLIPLIGDILDRLNKLDPQRSKQGLVEFDMPASWTECPGPGNYICTAAGPPGVPIGFNPRTIPPTHWVALSLGSCSDFGPQNCYNNRGIGGGVFPLPVTNWGGGRLWFLSHEGSQAGLWTMVRQFIRTGPIVVGPGNPWSPGVPNYVPGTESPPFPAAPGWLDPDPVGVPVGDPLPDIAPPVRWSRVRRPVPWRAPSEQTQWGPLPARQPQPMPEIVPGLSPSTPGVPGPSIVITPTTRTVTASASSPRRRPPGKGVKERKVRLAGGKAAVAYAVLSKAFGQATEYEDFIDGFYKSIPQKDRPKCKTLQCKVAAVYKNWDKIDMGEAIGRVLMNEIQDAAYGHIGQRIREATAGNPYYRGGRGLQAGGRFVQQAIQRANNMAGKLDGFIHYGDY